MMPVVRISDRNWERLKQHARPLEDTTDDVLSRALDALDGLKTTGRVIDHKEPKKPEIRTTRPSKKLPQKEFRRPLLETLRELGGSARASEVRTAIEPKVKNRLSEADHDLVSTGEPRWWNAVCWERSELVKEGLLRGDSERGVWELNAEGRRAAG